MRRIVGLSDSHFHAAGARFPECVRVHRFIEGWITEHKPDLVVHGGDIYERTSAPHERNMAAEWLVDIARTCPVVIVRGNHDAHEDLEIFHSLKSEHPILVFERPGTLLIAGVALACLPWPRKEHILTSLGITSQEAGEQASHELLRQILLGLATQLAEHKGPRLFVGHAMVRGSRTSVGAELVGTDLELGLEDLALVNAHAYHLGHIHMHQQWDLGGVPAIYPGAPYRTTFGEVEAKGFVVYEHDGETITDWEFIETPARPMVLIEAEWDPKAGQFVDRSECWVAAEQEGAEVRLRYHVASEDRLAARAAAETTRTDWLELGAATVKLDEVVQISTEARAPEVAAAQTLGEKLEAMWRARGDHPGPERAARLLEKALTLETEVTTQTS